MIFYDCEMGASARAIAHRGYNDHPYDPADLRRCMDYCNRYAIDTGTLLRRMAGRSLYWDALMPHWDELVAMLVREMETSKDGRAPTTYARMRELLGGVRPDGH